MVKDWESEPTYESVAKEEMASKIRHTACTAHSGHGVVTVACTGRHDHGRRMTNGWRPWTPADIPAANERQVRLLEEKRRKGGITSKHKDGRQSGCKG